MHHYVIKHNECDQTRRPLNCRGHQGSTYSKRWQANIQEATMNTERRQSIRSANSLKLKGFQLHVPKRLKAPAPPTKYIDLSLRAPRLSQWRSLALVAFPKGPVPFISFAACIKHRVFVMHLHHSMRMWYFLYFLTKP